MTPLSRCISRFILACALTTAAATAVAVPLPNPVLPAPSTDTSIFGTTVAARPELAGVVLEDVLSPYSFTGTAGQTLAGEIQNRVVRSNVDGTLDFYWRIIPDVERTGPNDLVTAFRVGGFGAFALDGDFRTDGLGTVGPDIARNFGTGSVNFLFDPGVPRTAGSSNFFFLDTQATTYTKLGQFDLLCAGSGCISQLYPTFAPTAAVPEPSTWLLMALGVGVLAIARKRMPG